MSHILIYRSRLTLTILCLIVTCIRAYPQGNTVITYGIREGMYSNNISSMFRDSKGRIWVSGYTSGVSMFEGSKWHRYSVSNGLASNYKGKIGEDKDGNIWIGHFKGSFISKISKNDVKVYTLPSNNELYLYITDNGTPACLILNSNTWQIGVYNKARDTFEMTGQKFTLKDPSYMGYNLRKDIYLWIYYDF